MQDNIGFTKEAFGFGIEDKLDRLSIPLCSFDTAIYGRKPLSTVCAQ